MAESLSRLIYVDDSGRQRSGLVVFGWVEFAPEDWASVLDGWLEARKRLRREFGIVADRELHSTDYINGRGRITDRPPARFTHQGQVYWRDLGQAAAVMLLKELSSMRGLTVGSVYRSLDPDPTGHDKVAVNRYVGHEFAWDWYAEYLAVRDPHRAPQQI